MNKLTRTTQANPDIPEPTQMALSSLRADVHDELSTLYAAPKTAEGYTVEAWKFSFDETVCGEYDGKTLYRKMFYIGALPNATQITCSGTEISGANVIKTYGRAQSGSIIISLPHSSTFNVTYSIQLHYDGRVIIITGVDRRTFLGTVIVEYTKG